MPLKPSNYYVSTFSGIFVPPLPPLFKREYRTESKQKFAFSDTPPQFYVHTAALLATFEKMNFTIWPVRVVQFYFRV